MLKALFGSPKNDPYNQALGHFRKLRDVEQSGPVYVSNLMMIVRLCQLTLKQRPADGDAHVLLANAYLLLALDAVLGPAYDFSILRGAAVIFHWRANPMYSKEQAIGARILQGVSDQLAAERPKWMGPALSQDLGDLHREFYGLALDPAALDQLVQLRDAPAATGVSAIPTPLARVEGAPIRTFLVNCVPERAEFFVKLLRLELTIEVVGEAGDGEEGLRQALAARPELLITCVSLPSMSGLDMIRELRNEGARFKILVATAGPTGEAEALSAGADAHLALPASSDKFISTVRQVLARQA